MNTTFYIQDAFLNQLRKNHMSVTIHLTNGYQLRGHIKGFDNFVVIFFSEGKQMMIYKHAISSVTPAEPIEYYTENDDKDPKADKTD
jgi:host factor-I protein